MSIKTKTVNPPTEKDDLYAQATEQAEAGHYEQALDYLQRYLEDNPDDAEALNDVGAILFSQGQTDRAIEHFVSARNNCGGHAEILWNLSEAYLADSQAEKAAELFSEMEQKDLLNPDLVNRTAEVFLNDNKLDDAIAMLEKSLVMSPQQEILKPMINIIRSKITSQNRCHNMDTQGK